VRRRSRDRSSGARRLAVYDNFDLDVGGVAAFAVGVGWRDALEAAWVDDGASVDVSVPIEGLLRDDDVTSLIYFASSTGLRSGEIAGLQRRDMDLLRGVVHVRRALRNVNGKLEVGETKTRETRTVSLPAFL
jgi:integrase